MEFQLAKELGKFHYEVLDMPSDEFEKWYLYFEWEREQQKKAEKKSKAKSGGKTVKTY